MHFFHIIDLKGGTIIHEKATMFYTHCFILLTPQTIVETSFPMGWSRGMGLWDVIKP